jgi:hypothetical protein
MSTRDSNVELVFGDDAIEKYCDAIGALENYCVRVFPADPSLDPRDVILTGTMRDDDVHVLVVHDADANGDRTGELYELAVRRIEVY